jgi:hypothetical protein
VVAALMNLRSRLTGIATGDQAIFVQTACSGNSAVMPTAADGRHRTLPPPAPQPHRPACELKCITSGRRWDSRGAWRTIVLMWRLRWRYWRGESPEVLARAYR